MLVVIRRLWCEDVDVDRKIFFSSRGWVVSLILYVVGCGDGGGS